LSALKPEACSVSFFYKTCSCCFCSTETV